MIFIYRGVVVTVSGGARYGRIVFDVIRCSGWRESQLQNVGRGITVIYGVCKDVFDVPTTME